MLSGFSVSAGVLFVLAGMFSDLAASDAITLAGATGSECRQPRVAVMGEHVVVTYAVGESILVTTSTDSGKTFAKPVQVGAITRLHVGMRRGPQIALTEKSLVIAAIGANAGNIQAWRSSDLGATWSSPVTVNDQPKSADEGLFSLAAGASDTVWAVWLDSRQKKSQIVMSRSVTGGSRWSANSVFYTAPGGNVCECCQPQVASDGKAGVAVMWRNQVGEARDMWLRTSNNGGATFNAASKLGTGSWVLNACPMDGGGIAIHGTAVQTIWRRESTLFSIAPPATKESSLGDGKNGTVLIAEKTTYRAWQKGDRIMIAVDAQEPRDLGAGSYPHLAGGINAQTPVFVVWESGSDVKAQRLDL